MSKQNEPSTPVASASTYGPWWRLPLLLAVVLIAMIAYRLANPPSETVVRSEASSAGNRISADIGPTAAVAGETVALAIDFGNGAEQRFTALGWKAEMTVLDLMHVASEFRPGIDFSAVGTGESAFLTSIGGIENGASEGAGGGRFWQFWVNDSRGDRSFGVYSLRPGDNVLWKFAPEE